MTIEVGKSSGGGGLPINSQLAMNYRDSLYVAKDGTEWLKTGFVEDDLSAYPDAFSSWQKNGIDFTATGLDAATNICSDGTYIYTIDNAGFRNLRTFDTAGNVIATVPVMNPPLTTFAKSTGWDGVNFWTMEANTVRRYTSAWADDSFNFSIASVGNEVSMAVLPDTILIMASNGMVVEFDKTTGADNGVIYTLENPSTGSPKVFTYGFDGFLWVMWGTKVYQTDPSTGALTGRYVETSLSTARDISFDSESIGLIVINTYEVIEGFGEGVGSGIAGVDSDSQLPIYVRIK